MQVNFYDDYFKIESSYKEIAKLYRDKKYNSLISKSTKYLNDYPNNTKIRFMRAKSYRELKDYENAINDLKFILNKKGNEVYALTELFYLYYFLNMYAEAIKLLPTVYETKCINSTSVSIAELVMKTHLKIDMKVKKGDKCDYIRTQILNYSANLALQHIKSHGFYNEKNSNDKEKSYFNENVNIEYLYQLVRKSIKDSEKANIPEILEVHYFGISNIGVYKNNNCNFIKVVVVPNTNNVVAMYPTYIVDYNNVSNIDCDYDELFKREKTKKLSQIDRFKIRYKV